MWLTWMSGITFTCLMWQNGLFGDVVSDAPPVRDQGLWQTLIMVAIALSFFYLILWRPEQKRRKAAEEQRAALKKGDRVTAMGIVGTVVRLQDQTVILKMFDGSQLEFLKAAITEVLPSEEGEKSLRKEESK